MLNVTFSLLSFVVFGCVLFSYNLTIFCIFLLASILYALWIALFLGKRKILDYELFEKQAENSNKTYQFITAMQEIKLQRLRATPAMGMGRCTGGSVRRANEKFEAATNTGGRKHIHQRSEKL